MKQSDIFVKGEITVDKKYPLSPLWSYTIWESQTVLGCAPHYNKNKNKNCFLFLNVIYFDANLNFQQPLLQSVSHDLQLKKHLNYQLFIYLLTCLFIIKILIIKNPNKLLMLSCSIFLCEYIFMQNDSLYCHFWSALILREVRNEGSDP